MVEAVSSSFIDLWIGFLHTYLKYKSAMMTPLELLQHRRDDIRLIAAKHGAYNIRVFGSVVRGEAKPESDIDFLIDKGPTTSSWFPAGLVLELEELLGRRIEIVTEKALLPYLRDRVLREAVPL
jgi:predicted nucleotidyltransferase